MTTKAPDRFSALAHAIPAEGYILDHMRDNLGNTAAGRALISRGDVGLYWLNQGDVSNAIIAHMTAHINEPPKPEQAASDVAAEPAGDTLRVAARDMVEAWDWWTADEYDRCQGVVAGAVDDLRLNLAAASAPIQPAPPTNLMELIRWAHDTLYEINPSNYDHDEVCRLNDASVEVILGLAQVLNETHGNSAEWWASRQTSAPQPAPPTPAEPAPMDREALVGLLQIITRNGSLDDGGTLHEVIADALLAAGWRRDSAEIRAAATDVLKRWDSTDWKAAPTADVMNRLRYALRGKP